MAPFKWDERALTVSQLVEAYFRQLITEGDYLAAMDARGISGENASLLIQVKQDLLSVAQITRGYQKGMLTVSQARAQLEKKGYPLELIDLILQDAQKDLSYSQVLSLFTSGEIEVQEAITRLRTLGYKDEDIPYLFELGERFPSKTDIRKMYELGLIEEGEVKEYFSHLGYSTKYVEYSALLVTKERELEQLKTMTAWLKDSLVYGIIDEVRFRRYAGSIGYNTDEIDLMIQEVYLRRDIEGAKPGYGRVSYTSPGLW
ncbi:hypothetical protein ES703_102448 [subsurface metagenome]